MLQKLFIVLFVFFGFTQILAKHTDAEYHQHAEQIKSKLKNRGFTVLIEKPFVVIGDEAPETVKRRSQNTVKWAVEKLKRDFFTRDPENILNIWLFKDEISYRKHAKEFFDDEPETPYGYYSSAHKALVMNIATGGGTLVHEIVHPFMEANFPDCPAWFNEGMGSLFEQAGEEDGHIVGYTNWRLAGLQRAIRQKTVPSFKTLLSTTDRQFYNADPGTNYAQSRYLLFYLQQKGLLIRFYKAFYANRKTDPTGYQTLETVLGENNLFAFQTRWESFVLDLVF